MLSPLPLLIKRSAYQVWPTTVALSTPPGFLVHFCRNTTTCPTEKSNDWGTLSPAVLGKRSYQQPSTMLRSWTYNWQAFLVEAKPGNHSGWYTQPQWQWSSIDGYSKVIGLKGGGWYLEVCATGMLWLDHRTPCLSHLSAWKSSVQPKPRHGHLNRTSCCFEIAVSANQTTPGNFWQKRKLWDLSKIAFQTPIFHSWIADELKIQQNYDQDKTLAASETEQLAAGLAWWPLVVSAQAFMPQETHHPHISSVWIQANNPKVFTPWKRWQKKHLANRYIQHVNLSHESLPFWQLLLKKSTFLKPNPTTTNPLSSELLNQASSNWFKSGPEPWEK